MALPSAAVMAMVFAARQAHKVRKIVVQRIVIRVMDVMACRYFPVLGFPDFLMEPSDSIRSVCPARGEVHPA